MEWIATCSISIVVLTVVVLTLLQLLFFYIFRCPHRSVLGRGFEATPHAIRVPKAPGGLDEIHIDEVQSIRTVENAFGPGVRLESEKGVLTLPISTLGKLEEAGYDVEEGRLMGGSQLPYGDQPPQITYPGFDLYELKGALMYGDRGQKHPSIRRLGYAGTAFLLALSVLSMVLSVLLMGTRPQDALVLFLSSIAMSIAAGYSYTEVRRPDFSRTMVHANGVVYARRWNFVPYGAYEMCDGLDRDPRMLILKAPGGYFGLIDPDDFADFEGVVDFVKARVADPWYDSEAFHLVRERWFQALHVMTVVTTLLMAYGGSNLYRVLFPGSEFMNLVGSTFSSPFVVQAYQIVPFWMIYYVIFMWFLTGPLVDQMPMRRTNLHPVFTFLFVTLALFSYLPATTGFARTGTELATIYALSYFLAFLFFGYLHIRNRHIPPVAGTTRRRRG